MELPDRISIPSTIEELHDYLYRLRQMRAAMKHDAFPKLNDGVAFEVFREGLAQLKGRLGDDSFDQLLDLTNRVEIQFRLDPDETNGEAHKGFLLITEMEELLMDWKSRRKARRAPTPSE